MIVMSSARYSNTHYSLLQICVVSLESNQHVILATYVYCAFYYTHNSQSILCARFLRLLQCHASSSHCTANSSNWQQTMSAINYYLTINYIQTSNQHEQIHNTHLSSANYMSYVLWFACTDNISVAIMETRGEFQKKADLSKYVSLLRSRRIMLFGLVDHLGQQT